jgi:ATP-binding cassette subfamily C (CFTR/MRP) protein 1
MTYGTELYWINHLILVAIILLWFQVSYATLGGLAVMFLMIPLNGVIVKRLAVLQKEMMKSKDARVKIINEVLQGIRV